MAFKWHGNHIFYNTGSCISLSPLHGSWWLKSCSPVLTYKFSHELAPGWFCPVLRSTSQTTSSSCRLWYAFPRSLLSWLCVLFRSLRDISRGFPDTQTHGKSLFHVPHSGHHWFSCLFTVCSLLPSLECELEHGGDLSVSSDATPWPGTSSVFSKCLLHDE